MKENINALDELSKGACMGMDAIHFILDKIEDEEFKESLTTQYEKYQNIEKKIRMKTLTDTSNSKIAELLMQGTNMGIIEGRKLLNNKKVDKEVEDLISEYVTMQEDSVENLKKYL